MVDLDTELGLLALGLHQPPHRWLNRTLSTRGRIEFDRRVIATTVREFPWSSPFYGRDTGSSNGGGGESTFEDMDGLRNGYEAAYQ